MIVKIKRTAKQKDVANLKKHLINKGFEIHDSIGHSISLFGVVGDTAGLI